MEIGRRIEEKDFKPLDFSIAFKII